MIPPEQAETAAFLRRRADADPIETHISAVFLGPGEAVKLRKAIRLGFLDFTSLAERERTARRELALNAPGAPGLYRDVVPVTRGPDGLALGGAGAVVDWVVRMARVPADDFLDRMAARGAITPDLLRAIADAVAAMHLALPPLPRDQSEAFRYITLGNARSALDAGLDPPTVRAWMEACLAWLAAHAPWLQARAAAGFVRRGHGDLHLGNLCLWQGRPVAFDALEFDEDLAVLDVGYDLAFLLMDLEFRLDRAQANAVLNRYVARTGDAGLLAGLPLFLAERAMIRAHVQAARFVPGEPQAYLRHAQAALAAPAPVLLAIGGLPGAGKSTLARALAPAIGAPPGALILRSDEIRKRQHGVAPETRLPPEAYSPDASTRVFDELATMAATAIAGGHSVIADATFMAPAHRTQIAAAAGKAPFHGVWLEAPPDVLRARVAARQGDASDADLAVLDSALRAGAGPGAWHAVAATDTAAATAACRALLGA